MGSKLNSNRVLCVDLDHCLIKTDLLVESLVSYLKQGPRPWIDVCLWLPKGRSFLKSKLAEQSTLNPSVLPFNEDVVGFIRKEKEAGTDLVLATASNIDLANQVAGELDLFSEVLASDIDHNLKGQNKADALRDKFGSKKFDYIGDSYSDLPVWQEAERSYLVGPSGDLEAKIRAVSTLEKVFPGPQLDLKVIMKTLRVHQWLKNLLVFVAPLMAHTLFMPKTLWLSVIAFFSFSLAASSIYILNDLFDLEADRAHKTKQLRCIASGKVKLTQASLLGACSLLASLILTILFLDSSFLLVLAVYVLATTLYSTSFKKVALLDIFILAGLYCLRVFAGAVAASVEVSPWLLAFSLFFFLSLACVKRYSELFNLKLSGKEASLGRGYGVGDIELLMQFGVTAGYLSVLVLALYLNSDKVAEMYATPYLLWFQCVLIMFWISRLWFLAHRGKVDEDPVSYAASDKVSWAIGLVSLALIYISI